MTTGRSPSNAWVAPMLLTLGATVLGLGAGWFLRGAPPPVSGPAPAPTRSTDGITREEFESAQRSVLARLDELARLRVPSPGPATSADGTANELGQRLDDLSTRVALLERSPARIRDESWRDGARGPGKDSTLAILECQPEGQEILDKAFMLWGMEDVVRQFGKPDRMSYLAPDWSLVYRVPGCATPDGHECRVFFHLHDDCVTRVECYGRK